MKQSHDIKTFAIFKNAIITFDSIVGCDFFAFCFRFSSQTHWHNKLLRFFCVHHFLWLHGIFVSRKKITDVDDSIPMSFTRKIKRKKATTTTEYVSLVLMFCFRACTLHTPHYACVVVNNVRIVFSSHFFVM